MASLIAYCVGCDRNTRHVRRRDGVTPIKSILALGLLKVRYYRCTICSYRVWFPKKAKTGVPTIKD